jgi:PPM family protein phosphatase
MRITWASGTHQGRVRTNNEDALYPLTSGSSLESTLFAVADGMGGHVAGEVASSQAIQVVTSTEGPLADRIQAANDAIVDAAIEDRSLFGMGTTITMAEVDPEGTATIAHVGDSRAYLLHLGVLEQITEDHTIVAEYLAAGKIRPEDIANHPHRSMITRALGLMGYVEVDTFTRQLLSGDRLLLCTDGLNSMVSDERIERYLQAPTPDDAVWDLIEAANAAGGHDNVSLIVIDFGS